jgi:hypothetical protein
MNHKRIISILAVTLTLFSECHAQSRPSQRDPSRAWLDRPWEIRYVLFVDRDLGMRHRIQIAKRLNTEQVTLGKTHVYLDAEEMFKLSAIYAIPRADKLALVLIQFDAAGHANSANPRLGQYTGKRNLLDDLVLVRTGSHLEQPYYFARWSQGVPGAEHFSPAICAGDDSHRYDDDWSRDDYSGGFGCREWTAQLYSSEQPYIDVTSYSKRGNFIGEFVGWSRFSDPPKPVIGAQGKTWLCLHECPAGEKPGVIADIKAWTRKHGFPMPERPPKQPLYPNSDYKDDIEE